MSGDKKQSFYAVLMILMMRLMWAMSDDKKQSFYATLMMG
jgi:hypothetical protein